MHVFDVDSDAADEDAEAARRWRMNGSDWRGFLAAYSASFVAISLFIA